MKTLLIAAVLSASFADVAFPQQGQPKNCHGQFTSTLASGRPHGDLQACGSTLLPDVVNAIAGMRTQRDTQMIRTLVGIASGYRDPAVLDAALGVVSDRGASHEARMGAFAITMSQFRRNASPRASYTTFGQFLTRPLRFTCQWDATTADYVYSKPLPTNFLDRIKGTAADLTAASDLALSSFAACVVQLINAVVPPPVPPDAVSVEYLCGRDFVVRNSSGVRAEVRYSVDGADDDGSVDVPPHEQQFIHTFEVGTVRIFLGDQLIGSAENEGKACPGH
ncbi:MAG: hypothetical protein JO306_14845 [Gemmatimonadetes bacterium]|nr:hypothetical protein [Gemmatimonadota bacterium]